jgi:hypothetical protein
MPVSEAILIEQLGIEPQIAQFFVQRKRPGNNEYWLKQTHYVSLSTGYIFIPVFFDLLVKKGLSVESLLAENFLVTMESILQSAGRMEYRKISEAEHVLGCRLCLAQSGYTEDEIEAVEKKLVYRSFSRVPSRYTSLRRANTFLYLFAGREADFERISDTWELLLPLLLILDDFADLEQDQVAGEENCLLDGGKITENMFELIGCAGNMIRELATINVVLSTYLTKLKDEAVARNMLKIMSKAM